jgi:RNA polymerase sigma-70 factor, ECF subfamily
LSLLPENIIEGCTKGISKYQEQLYHHYYADMIKLCCLYTTNIDDAGTIYNTAMLKVFSNIKQYKGEGSISAWIRRIVVNCCIDFCRSKTKFVEKTLPENYDTYSTAMPDAYTNIEAKEVMAFIKALPVQTSLVFNMYVLEGYKHEEIATLLGISTGTSKWHLSEARRVLKNKILSLTDKSFYLHAI